MRLWALAAAALVGSCVAQAPPAPAPHARSCTFIEVDRDSVFVATYTPPCDGSTRPPGDTIRTWRIPNQQPGCPLQGIIDDAKGDVRFRWQACRENPTRART